MLVWRCSSLVGDVLGGPKGPENEGFLRMPVDGAGQLCS